MCDKICVAVDTELEGLRRRHAQAASSSWALVGDELLPELDPENEALLTKHECQMHQAATRITALLQQRDLVDRVRSIVTEWPFD